MTQKNYRLQALRAAFPYTVPILTGFAFLGFAYGVYMNVMGFPFYYPFLMALVIFGGSLEFVAVTMLMAPFAPLASFLLALLIQARHLFYGLALFDTYRGLGWKRFFLIYGLCDETFSILFTAKRHLPEGVDRGWFMLWITWLDEGYWVFSALIGGLVGGMLPFDTTGLGFVMTAMFVVIFLEQWLNEKCHATALLGLVAAGGCLALFGADSFMIPAMVTILVVLILTRQRLAPQYMPAVSVLDDTAAADASAETEQPAPSSGKGGASL